MSEGAKAASKTPSTRAAALFDLRSVIALLFGVYGVVLLIMSFSDSQAELDKAGGIHINLWTGIAMIVMSVLFVVWVVLRPPVVADVDEDPEDQESARRQH